MAERLALPISDKWVAGPNPAGGEILPEPKRRFIAQSISCSPSHRLGMTELLLKGRKNLTHSTIYSIMYRNESSSEPHCPNVDFLSVNIVNTMAMEVMTGSCRKDFISVTLATPYDITRREEAAIRFWSIVFMWLISMPVMKV